MQQTELIEGDTASSARLAEFLAIAPTLQDTEIEPNSTMPHTEDRVVG
jgi:hypothetical protein